MCQVECFFHFLWLGWQQSYQIQKEGCLCAFWQNCVNICASVFVMEDTKDAFGFKGVAERLTLGIARILGVYCVMCMFISHLCWELLARNMILTWNNVLLFFLFGPENMPGVVDVRFAERDPAEKRSLLSWEQVEENFLLWCNLKNFCSVFYIYIYLCIK